jgi:integrase
MTDNLTVIPPDRSHELAQAGAIANDIAGRASFTDYRQRKAPRTRARQDNDLHLLADYLRAAGLTTGDFANDPQAWRGITWGLVAGFVRWMLLQSYAVASINVSLSTIKVYARLAFQAGMLSSSEYAQILTVKGYRKAEAKHIDEERDQAGLKSRRMTRRGMTTKAGIQVENRKKTESVSLTKEQASALKDQPNTPQGRRDRLIMCLLLDHGLRVGEVAGLSVSDFDLKAGEMRFYRPKVDKVQTHRLTPDTLQACRDYLANDAPALGSLWRGSASKREGKAMKGQLTQPGMSARSITKRVKMLGKAIGVLGLSAHDCRHHWATMASRAGTPIDRLQDAGGWSSPTMPLRYIEAARIANEGVNL